MEFQKYIQEEKKLYYNIFDFIENESDDNDDLFFDYVQSRNISDDKNEFRLFLLLISRISTNHFINQNISTKVEKILILYKDQIRQTFSNTEIFNIFKKDKRTLLFLVNEGIISIDESISQIMLDIKNSEMQFGFFFYPEIKKALGEETVYFQIQEDFILKDFEKNRKIGQNDSYICELIRNDSVEEFIQYVNKTNYSLLSRIKRSFFETNYFLIKNEPTLIEYAAFFGSIQIFNYLRYNEVDLTPSLWLYSIHSSNPNLIHFLEENDIEPPENEKNSYLKCLKESIKCHHNNITIYINDNLMISNHQALIQKYCYRYYNYQFLNDDLNESNFPYLCKYEYIGLIEPFLKDVKIKSKNIINSALTFAALKNYYEIVNYILKETKIETISVFERCTLLTQISIPPSVTAISDSAFSECSSLEQIIISSSVTSIGKYAFFNCASLTQITIPHSVKTIGEYAFLNCASLKHINFIDSKSTPSNLTSINYNLFQNCSSIEKVVIPSSVVTIDQFAFYKCTSLKEVVIPPSVKKIFGNSFDECSSIKQIYIPSSVEFIDEFAFKDCISLVQVSLPSSLKSIVHGTFMSCLSLAEITIPSSVTKIDTYSFSGCISLTSIVIPPSVEIIGSYAFYGCKSLTNIEIHSSVKSIEMYAFCRCCKLTKFDFKSPCSLKQISLNCFYGCSSLKEISIPSSITSIEDDAFNGCSSLEHIHFESPSTLCSIGSNAFKFCSSLVEIEIPSIKIISDSLFYNCTSLKKIIIPPSVIEIQRCAFFKCESLSEIIIPNTVLKIEELAFSKCHSLKQIKIPSSINENLLFLDQYTKVIKI